MTKLLLGDCLDKLKELESNSVDSVVTDPPYGLGFMGKQWDIFDKSQFGNAGSEGVNDLKVKKNFKTLPRYRSDNSFYEFSFAWAKEVFRVLKPGGHLLSFGGSRTYHRMACAIEDAGFEIRDMIEWVYGSGFPKSHNIGKAIDKKLGNEREHIRDYKTHDIRNNGLMDKKGLIKVKETKGNSEWEGWGTALKPAHEPIVMARKPLSEKTVANNVLKFGTGGINIDESRVDVDLNNEGSNARRIDKTYKGKSAIWNNADAPTTFDGYSKGRFPANLIHDGSKEITDVFKDKSRFFYCAKTSKVDRNEGLQEFKDNKIVTFSTANGTSGKASSISEGRNTTYKNSHPTVKPTKLMRYLVKLVTPKGGTVLDPFMGSGSTGKACMIEGFNFIGIEKEKEYIKIARARINDAIPKQSRLVGE